MKIYLLKTAYLILFVIYTGLCSAQTTITINSCDTTLTNPGMNLPFGDCIVTVRSTNTTSRLSYNTEQFYNMYGGPVSIYDGPNTSATLITILGDPFIYSFNQKYGSQTTGNSITLKYRANNASDPRQFKIRIRCVDTPVNIPVFQPLKGIPVSGNITAKDFDGDGDKDFLVGGKLFKNDSYFDTAFKFERRNGVLDGWWNVKITSADFDNDGYKDIFITGISSVFVPGSAPSAAIYKNNGNGTFSLITTTNFVGANRGACSVVDFNNDGRPDICYTGSTDYFANSPRVFKLYLNNGNFGFTDANVSLPGISGLVSASMDWADSDNDGDKDLIINGHDGNNNFTALFTSNGNIFTNKGIEFTKTNLASIMWVDFNKDGKPDIVNRGAVIPDHINAIAPEIFMNNGNNQFTRLETNLPKLTQGGMDWADYDGDNDLDLVYDGLNAPAGIGMTSFGVYKNNGNGVFVAKDLSYIKSGGRVKWYDFNNDGKLDIICDAGSFGEGGVFVKNMGNDSFKVSSFHFPANQYYDYLTVIDDFNNDGLIDILSAGGKLNDVDCNYNSSSSIVWGRGWKLTGIPKFTQVANVNPTGSSALYYTWGDFDSDHKPDILVTAANFDGINLQVYRNNGDNTFSLYFNSINTPLPPPPYNFLRIPFAGMIDMDNDGINELMIGSNVIYKKSGNQWLLSTYDLVNSPGYGYFDFADFDKDGYMDVVVSGASGTAILRNDRNGKLVNITTPPQGYTFGTVGPSPERQIKWHDMNNDGWLDVMLSNGLLEYRNGEFVYINSQLPDAIHFDIADFNSDGYPDIITVPKGHNWGSLKTEYNQHGSFFFKEVEHGVVDNTTGSSGNESVVAFDVDNDGDNDFIFSGPLCNGGTSILVNEGVPNQKTIHLVSPNGNENYFTGNTYNVKWIGNLIASTVKLEASLDSGRTWQLVIASAPSTTSGGNFNWTVGSQTSTKCLFRVSDGSTTQLTDKSDQLFSISTSPPIANAGKDTTICLGDAIQIGKPPLADQSYSWTSDAGGYTSTLSNPIVNPGVTTKYFLQVTKGTLIAKDTVLIEVLPCDSSNISLFPNPANQELTIKLDASVQLPVLFVLSNSNGSAILNQVLNTATSTINLTNILPSVYFYSIKSQNGQILKSGILLIVH